MATLLGTGISAKLDSFTAGKEAALNAYYQIGKNDPGIVITFISPIFDQQETIRGIRSITRDTQLIGCSSIGAISSYGSHKDSVAVFIISSDSMLFSCGIGDKVSKSPGLAGNKTVIKALGLTNKSKLKQAYMMFSDGASGQSANILRGSQEVLGTGFPIIGGGACNKTCDRKTYQYMDSEALSDSVSGALISGDIRLGIGTSNGWQPLGKTHKITKARSNTIKEIDKKIAVRLYEEYFEKSIEELKNYGICALGITYPIGTRSANFDDYITRVPIAIDDAGGLLLNGDIKEEDDISLMIGDKDAVLESAKKAATSAVKDISYAKIKFAAIFSDMARLLVLKDDAYKEMDAVKEVLGRNIPILGCYTFGEYAPSDAKESHGQCNFNNHSISITLFSE
ncbi:MAG: FIST N-terminal domain-containing protein [Candidatus Omnitrophota bacterium]|nr:FIST N-terminal domain-containing protein [Candidatus Omnitrophota bacterium]